MSPPNLVPIFGVKFLHGSYDEAMSLLLNGALMVVPSGPGLATIENETEYLEAIRGADFAIPDSGLMVLLCRLLGIGKLTKLSGLEFLNLFFDDRRLADKRILLVDPNETEAKANLELVSNLPSAPSVKSYIAPQYTQGTIVDNALIEEIAAYNPDFVLLNIGGGVQERVGYFLRKNLTRTPGIICTGAAIAFLTGHQAHIPGWADRIYLGWLLRCLSNPRAFVPRYLRAFNLVPVMLRYRLFHYPEQ